MSTVEHLSPTYVAQKVTKFITVNDVNLVTPKAGAEHELLFNKPASATYLFHVCVVSKLAIKLLLENR